MRDVTDLVRLAMTGDRNALVAAVQDDIWRFQRSRTDAEADAEDATQETFARMIAGLPELRDPRTFAGWLYRIALNVAHAEGRRRGAEERAADALAAAASTSTEQREAEAMERAELQAKVRKAVGGLEPRLRTAVELRYEHGLSYADIARAMDCPEGTVADRLHVAHDRLRRVLAGAGVAIALATLERELAAAPAVSAPARLGSRLERLALEGPRSVVPPGGPRPRTVALMLGAAAILAGLVAWRLVVRGGKPSDDAGAPVVAGAGPASSSGSPTEAGVPAGGHASEAATSPASPTLGRIQGRVLRRDGGDPIPGATVVATLADDPTNKRIPHPSTADARGDWTLDLPAGTWLLEARAPGYVPLGTTLMVERWRAREEAGGNDAGPAPTRPESVVLAAGATETRDLELQRGAQLSLRVIDRRGRPLAGVKASYTQQSLKVGPWPRAGFKREGYLAAQTTDVEGRCAFDGVFPEGELSLVLEGDEVVRREISLPIGAGEQTVELEVALPFEGVLLDAFGKPIRGARFFGVPDAQDNHNLMEVSATVDELGRFSVPPGAAGARLLVAWAPGYGVALVPLEGRAAGSTEIRLAEATGVVTGCVRDSGGRPVAGATVRLAWSGATTGGSPTVVSFPMPGGSWHWPDGGYGGCLPSSEQAPSAVTSADGTFRLDHVPAGDGAAAGILVTAPGFEPRVADVRAGTPAEIALQPEEEPAEEDR